jgi:cytochrome c oxidase subunit 4
MNTNQHVLSVRANLIVYAILLVLLLLTIGGAYLDLGHLNFPLAMAVAVTKATLIALFFMHARYSSRTTQMFALSGLLWLGILIALTLSDFLGRGWIGVLGK